MEVALGLSILFTCWLSYLLDDLGIIDQLYGFVLLEILLIVFLYWFFTRR